MVFSQTVFIQILFRFADVERAMGHQLDGHDKPNDCGYGQQHDGRDFSLAELVGDETGREQYCNRPRNR